MGETLEDNVWTRLLRDELGINVKYLWVAANDEQMEQKFNLAMASGDLPDIFNVSQTKLNRLAGSDMLQDMRPSLEYLSPLGKQIFADAGDVPFMQGTVNNMLYGIPFIGDAKEDSQFIFLRTDWLDNLGLAPPKTMDDMVNIIKAFVDKDPDGNGIKDTLGLGIKDELLSGGISLYGFFDGYHSYPRPGRLAT